MIDFSHVPGDLLPLEDLTQLVEVAEAINSACILIHRFNKRWWIDLATDLPLKRNVGEMLMLVVTEISEAMEGHRKNLFDEHLPQHLMPTVELGDAMIREFDIAGGLGLALGQAFFDKTIYNLTRLDHTKEVRMTIHGKKI